MFDMFRHAPSLAQDMVRDGYPLRAEWCAKSVCIGGEFQAFVRDKASCSCTERKASVEERGSVTGPGSF